MEPGVNGKALVTGASSGIGLAFAERLARDAYDLVIVARRRDRLEALAKRLRQEQGIEVEVVVADLTQPAELQGVEKLVGEDTRLELLVNNAGFGGYMPFISLPPERAEMLIRLHVVALTRLTRAALPGMIGRGHGAIVNVSSGLAFSAPASAPPLPFRAVYAATKAYINTFTEILQNEVEGAGVRLQALCPALVWTEFHERAGVDVARRAPRDAFTTPVAVVEASLAGLHLGEVICLPHIEEPTPVTQIREIQRTMFSGPPRPATIAKRYTS